MSRSPVDATAEQLGFLHPTGSASSQPCPQSGGLNAYIGFSGHDTIVVFDRIRENLPRYPDESFETLVNHSLTQTLGRSLSTSITTVLVMVALLLFGGVTIRPFVLALVIGLISGTYSSIFNASMLLVVWENGKLGRFVGRQRPAAEAARAPA